MRTGRLLVWLGSALMAGGAAVLTVYCYTLIHAAYVQGKAKQWMNAAAGSPPASSHAAVQPAVRHGDVLGELQIPRLKLSVMVFEGDDAEILKVGAGHIPGTALPSAEGNIGLAAHRDTFFRPLRMIHPGDVITLQTPSGASRFAVTGTEIVPPSDLKVLGRAPGRDLTLVTCYPFYYFGHAPRRFVVHARKVGS